MQVTSKKLWVVASKLWAALKEMLISKREKTIDIENGKTMEL